ncbi:MAG: Pnap_2097 family protein [Methylocella sp.]
MNFAPPASRAQQQSVRLSAIPQRESLIETPSAAALGPTVLLGMPHLSLRGVSENWLLKECGHRHWFMIAAAAGLPAPDFRDADGEPVYAAFCAATIRNAKFGALSEHDELSFSSSLARISRTQFVSIHKLTCFGREVGEVELVSVFVKRREKGKNRSITRIALTGFPAVERRLEFGHAAGIAAMIRADRWTEHFGFLRAGAREDAQLTIRPCPSQDFNGAGFLYFAAFQSFVDRAEWELLAMPALAHLTTAARHVIYHGNIEPGDRVVVKLLGQRCDEDLLSHWFQIAREDGAAKLADVFTLRQRQP